jgi:hypothetical protein
LQNRLTGDEDVVAQRLTIADELRLTPMEAFAHGFFNGLLQQAEP